MATTITRYVDPDSAGGNGTTTALSGANAAYASLNAAMTAEARNLVTADEIAEFICMSSHANHTADTTPVSQWATEWTTDATRYVDIKTDSASRHAGVWSDTKYRIVVNADPDADPGVVQLSFPYGRSTGIQVKNTWTGAGNPKAAYFGYGTSGHWRVSKNILVGGSGANIVNSGGYFFNNILYYFSGATRGTGVIRGNGGSWQVYNNTAVGFSSGYYNEDDGGTSTSDFINNLGEGNTTDFEAGWSWSTGTGYNASSDGTAPGTNSRTSQTFTFEAGTDNYHLASNDAGARDYGVSDPGSGLFSDDIDGETRSGTWDIGADEYVAAGGGATGGGLIFLFDFIA